MSPDKNASESGNVIVYVLIGIVLIGLVTAALRSSGTSNSNIDRETLVISASRVRQNAQEFERGIAFILQNGISESDLRFAHPDANAAYGDITTTPETQIFSPEGGSAEYRAAPPGINDGSSWEFYAHTRIPGAGSDRADLIAVLPNVTKAFCDQINSMNDQSAEPREIGGGCINDTGMRFNGVTQYIDAGTNLLDETAASFSRTPAMQACVDCNPAGPAHDYHFYHVLLAR